MTPETILIVDDERTVRETFLGWLREAGLRCDLFTAAGEEEALRVASERPVDLAILDWNLGAGVTGLDVLENLREFSPDIVAVMITGYAHQATPLMAMRLGVRDYLDKNQGLTRETFLDVVRRQLAQIKPARIQRHVNEGMAAFHKAVEQVLPLVRTAAALNDPVPVSEAARALLRFAVATLGAGGGVIAVRSYDEARTPPEEVRAYDANGTAVETPLAWASSLAAAAVSMGRPSALDDLRGVGLQPFEVGRTNLLAVPVDVAPGRVAVLELFDRPGGFGDESQRLAAALGPLASDVLRQALAEREASRLLLDALEQARAMSDEVRDALRAPEVAPPEVRERLEKTLASRADAAIDAGPTLRLAEAIRSLAVAYGPRAVEHCTRLVEGLRGLLDEVTRT
jgi:two-component system, NtrC family, nitrogen regulation response regulator NtrX